MKKPERRRESRERVQGLLPILWQTEDTYGEEWMGQAECLEISRSGIKLRLAQPLRWRSTVLFHSHKLGLAGRGIVRHCSLIKAAFEIGVECSGGVIRYSKGVPSLLTEERSQKPRSET